MFAKMPGLLSSLHESTFSTFGSGIVDDHSSGIGEEHHLASNFDP